MKRFSHPMRHTHQLLWMMERDKLDATFCRIASGFVIENNMKEAQQSLEKINQILIQYQKSQTTNTHTLLPLEPEYPPMSKGH